MSDVLDDLLALTPLPAHGAYADRRARGRLLAIVGSRGRPGGALLAALGALRVGCGSVRVAAPASLAQAVGLAVPELSILPLPESPEGELAHGALAILEAQFAGCDAIVIGPGLGADASAQALARRVMANAPKPLVADGRALRAMGPARTGGTGPLLAPRVYTTRDRELAMLIGQDLTDDRARDVLAGVQARGGTVVLQGRETLVGLLGGAIYAEPAGTRAMGMAGASDVLAGVIAGLLAQGLAPEAAAAWGVRLHGRAAALAASEVGEDGVLASDLLARLPRVQHEARA